MVGEAHGSTKFGWCLELPRSLFKQTMRIEMTHVVQRMLVVPCWPNAGKARAVSESGCCEAAELKAASLQHSLFDS